VDCREDAVNALKSLYLGKVRGVAFNSKEHTLRGHLLQRLKRLCSVPGDGRLSDAAKRALKEVFDYREEVPTVGHFIKCSGGKPEAQVSIAGDVA
jgi:hypothetical protein